MPTRPFGPLLLLLLPSAAAAYRAETRDEERGAAAKSCVKHPRGEVAGGGLVLSRIYDWYRADFGGSVAGVIAHLRRYASPALAGRLAGTPPVATTGP